MKAIVFEKETSSLVKKFVPLPILERRDIMVKLEAIGVNPIDIKVQKMLFEKPFKILGWDAYGEITQIGNDVVNFKIGDKVYYCGNIGKDGANSEYHSVDERLVSIAPKNLKPSSIASFPLVSLTAWEAIFERMQITPEESGKILIIGAAGGVGSIAIQILKKFTKMEVIATVNRKESYDWCIKMGADVVMKHEDISSLNPDYILCLGDTNKYIKVISEIIKPHGIICTLVAHGEPLDLTLIRKKSVAFCQEFVFTRPIFQTEDMHKHGEILSIIANALDDGILQDITTFSFNAITSENLNQAFKMLETGKTIGKITLYNKE